MFAPRLFPNCECKGSDFFVILQILWRKNVGLCAFFCFYTVLRGELGQNLCKKYGMVGRMSDEEFETLLERVGE